MCLVFLLLLCIVCQLFLNISIFFGYFSYYSLKGNVLVFLLLDFSETVRRSSLYKNIKDIFIFCRNCIAYELFVWYFLNFFKFFWTKLLWKWVECELLQQKGTISLGILCHVRYFIGKGLCECSVDTNSNLKRLFFYIPTEHKNAV